MAWAVTLPALGQNIDGLVFNEPFQANNANHPVLGGYYTGTSFNFLDVAPTSGQVIDARVSISAITSERYSLGGTFPRLGNDGDDLGFLYSYTGGSGLGGNFGEGGLTYQLDFFRGGGDFNTPVTLSNISLKIYDIDGEPSQSESVMVFAEDGFNSYQLSDTNALALTIDSGSYRFSGPMDLYDRADPATSVILHYSNTSSIRLRMITNTNAMSQSNNAVFGGIDGNPGSVAGFDSPIVVVPEPSVALLACLGLIPWFRRRR